MDAINDFLDRGVAQIIPSKTALGTLLHSGNKLNIYNGIDPTASQIHLGHSVPLRKLQKLVELGHHVTFLIGDFTALIGDTSDKNSERPVLSEEQIEANWQDYKSQASKLLDFSHVNVVHNGEWLNRLSFRDVIRLARHFSVNDFISRELIKKRLQEGTSVNLAEVLYPLAQGYDSYHLQTDLQIGGTEQIFNIQAGRTLIKDFDHKESFVMTLDTLEGTDGRKMSKSWGNAIWLNDTPDEMFGKVMSLKDELIIQYFTLVTNIPLVNIQGFASRLKSGENPMIIKKILAKTIVEELHGPGPSKTAEENFVQTFSEKNIDFAANTVSVSTNNLIDALVEAKLVGSKSAARRLISQGGVSVNGQKILDEHCALSTGHSNLQVGKRTFARLILK